MGITPMRSLLMGALIEPRTDVDPTDAAILAATIRCLSHHGLSRMTVGDVAADAGVGRATVFRRFDTKEDLVRRAFAWELARIVDRFHEAIDPIDDPLERAIEWIVQAVQVVRTHPVARRLVADDAAVPILSDPQVTDMLLTSVAHELEITAQRAQVEFDVETASEMIVRFFTSVWLTPNLGAATSTDEGVRRIARTMLAFLVAPAADGT